MAVDDQSVYSLNFPPGIGSLTTVSEVKLFFNFCQAI